MKRKLYLFRHQYGPIKIGISKNPEERLRAIDGACPYNISLVTEINCDDAQMVESKLHNEFSEFNLSGEWFSLPKEIVLRFMGRESIEMGEVESEFKVQKEWRQYKMRASEVAP